MGHILSWGLLWIQSCPGGISEQCRSLSRNLIITCTVPNPYSTEKLICQNISLCLWSIRITCLIYNYLLLKSVTISLREKKNALRTDSQFPEQSHTWRSGLVISLIPIPTNQFVHPAQIYETERARHRSNKPQNMQVAPAQNLALTSQSTEGLSQEVSSQ